MTSIQPAWLGVLVIVIAVVAAVLVATGALYLLAPPVRRFLRGDRPVWWVRDVLIAVFVVVLVLFGQSYLVGSSGLREQDLTQAQDQDQDRDPNQDQRISDLNFVRFTSSVGYQERPFRGFDLRDMSLAGLKLRGANFVEANLGGANLAGTVLSTQNGTPAAPGQPAIPEVRTLLQGVNLCHAVLTGANLQGSFLINANFTGADLSSARLQWTVLNGADFSGATMPSDASYLEGIYFDDNTIWPEGFQPPPPSAGNALDKFLQNPANRELYGDVPRPECNS